MSIANEITRLQTAKSDIKTAIEAKGVTVPSSATIDTYDDYVTQISGGGGGGNPIIKSIDVEDFTGTTFNSWLTYITDITIPSGVIAIGEHTFQGCTSLASIDIPSGVTSIGQRVFQSCTSLSSVTVNAITPPTLGNYAFSSTPIASGTGTIYVPSASVEAYKAASGWSTYASRIQAIPS